MQPRSTHFVFIGYHSVAKGYRCLDTSTGQIYLSKHVVFDENVFSFSSSTTLSPPSLNDFQHFFWHIPQFSTNASIISSPRVSLPFTSPSNNPNSHTIASTSNPIASSPAFSTPNSNPTLSNYAPSLSYSSNFSPIPSSSSVISLTSANSSSPPTTAAQNSSQPSSSVPAPSNVHHMLTRSTHGIFKPKHPLYLSTIASSFSSSSSISEPKSYKEALLSPEWSTAMLEEYTALQNQGTWSLVSAPTS